MHCAADFLFVYPQRSLVNSSFGPLGILFSIYSQPVSNRPPAFVRKSHCRFSCPSYEMPKIYGVCLLWLNSPTVDLTRMRACVCVCPGPQYVRLVCFFCEIFLPDSVTESLIQNEPPKQVFSSVFNGLRLMFGLILGSPPVLA